MWNKLHAEVHMGFGAGPAHLLICREDPEGGVEILGDRDLTEDADGLAGLVYDPLDPDANYLGQMSIEQAIFEQAERVLHTRGYQLVGDWRDIDGSMLRFTAGIAERGQAVDDHLRAVTILRVDRAYTEVYRVWQDEVVEVVAATRHDLAGSPVVPSYASPELREAEEASDQVLRANGFRRYTPWALGDRPAQSVALVRVDASTVPEAWVAQRDFDVPAFHLEYGAEGIRVAWEGGEPPWLRGDRGHRPD